MKHMVKQKAAFFGEWVRHWWLRFFLFITSFRGHPVKYVASIVEIPDALGWGQHWKKDPGVADKWYHPRVMQERMDNHNSGYDDCDGHATYWCVQLLKNRLAREVSIGLIRFTDNTGKIAGHYVTLFRDAHGVPFWADYNLPTQIDHDIPWRWAHQVVASGYGTELHMAARYKVTLGPRDTPVIVLEALELF